MKKRTNLYPFFNIAVLFLSLIRLGWLIFKKQDQLYYIKKNSEWITILAVFLLTFVILHFVKMLRFYFIIIKEDLEWKRFVRIYVKTTFVTLILPFKLGELFRMYCFSHDSHNYKIGVLSIGAERFFDTCALLLFMVPIEWMENKRISLLSVLLFLFLGLIFTCYHLFLGCYPYINHFLIFQKKGKTSVKYLITLEKINVWHSYVKRLITGRGLVLFLLSLVSWILEGLMFWKISEMAYGSASWSSFSEYMNTSLGFSSNEISVFTSVGGAALFGLVILFIYCKKRKEEDDGECMGDL